MKKSTCEWCNAIVNVRDTFNEKKNKAVCSPACKAAEMLFQMHFNDEEVNRRAHYNALTRGSD